MGLIFHGAAEVECEFPLRAGGVTLAAGWILNFGIVHGLGDWAI